MKLILLYLAVVLCTVCKASIIRSRVGLHTSTGLGLGLFGSAKKNTNAKSSGGSKDDSVSDRGKDNLRNEFKLGVDASANLKSSLGTSDAHSLGRSETPPPNPALNLIRVLESLPILRGDIHGDISVGGGISRLHGSGSASSGNNRLNVDSSNGLSTESGDDHSLQGQEVAASSRYDKNVESSNSSTGSANSNEGAGTPSEHSSDLILEEVKDIGKKYLTGPIFSGTTSGSSGLHVHSSLGLSPELGDKPTVQGPQADASGTHLQNVDSNSSSTVSPTSNEGADQLSDHSRKLLEDLQEMLKSFSSDTSGTGTSSEKSRLSFLPSPELPTELSNGHVLQNQPRVASSTPNVDISGLSTVSSISNEENTHDSGDSNEVSGPSSSAVVATDSGDHGNLDDKQVPGLNGHEGDGENNSGSFGTGSLDTESKSGSHSLSSGSGSSLRSNAAAGVDPSDQNDPVGVGVSGRVACSPDKTVSG
ncbi:submandibular gland protein C-like [Grammomys surdaster]|uniref:submandibular gland protein C-like n=1 Tax=Grammomys surdaster TaxID=491861 RepID=UPI00109F1CFE|nr:submandibular gland protein C-like [Grammomys surdaster]